MSEKGRNIIVNQLVTDKIRNQFGEVSIEICEQTIDKRISIIADKWKIARVMAITLYNNDYSEDVLAVHNLIIKGGMIGQTFVNSGYNFVKIIECCFEIDSPDILKIGKRKSKSVGHFSNIFVVKFGTKEFYGQLCEIFSPEIQIDLLPLSVAQGTIKNLYKILEIGKIKFNNIQVIS